MIYSNLMMRKFFVAPVATVLILCMGCALHVQQKALHEPAAWNLRGSLDGQSPWLKAHLPNGDLYLLSNWQVDEAGDMITGEGTRLNARREVIDSGAFSVPLDSIAIFESNVVQKSPAMAGLTVLTVASVAMTLFCIANPKACFGSCPTFYARNEAGESMLMAEGFSASVAPALEDDDLDALLRTTATGSQFTLTMTNEALETHVVRHTDLLVAPRPAGGRVLAAQDGSWWQAGPLLPVTRAVGPEGDCTDLMTACDGHERFSLADSLYLGTKEFVELEFDAIPDGDLGLVIASRHSLLSTYLFYQGLAYLGQHAVSALARLDGAPESQQGSQDIGNILGRIEVQVPGPGDTWQTVGTTGETGPLAASVHMLRLPPLNPDDPRLRLRLTKGNWRLDYIALAALGRQVTPQRLSPSLVRRDGLPDTAALADLTMPDRSLISLPGDRFDLVYDLPDPALTYDVFLESHGYYLEWMRTEWLAEEDPAMAALMFLRPQLALSYLAPKFKELEPDMEAQFWGSRYAR